MNCPVCQSPTLPIGQVRGRIQPIEFSLRRCRSCDFSFVSNPIEPPYSYDEAYYRGQGADPLVDYIYELEFPGQTIRQYEWAGVLTAVSSLIKMPPEARWLDFGCGNGGLVRYVRQHTAINILGYETGWIADRARECGVGILNQDDLAALDGTFDVVTAIEVLEHISEPVAAVRTIRRLLRPGGLFFYTTGNAAPYRERLTAWSYVVPEIHVSFFEPGTMHRLLSENGFRPESRPQLRGFDKIIQFKVLKNLRVRKIGLWQRLVPWTLLARGLDRKRGISAHPVGWAI